MSREKRAELEGLQAELAAIRAHLQAMPSRVSKATALATAAKLRLAEVEKPRLQALEENQALENQIAWENSLWTDTFVNWFADGLAYLFLGLLALMLGVPVLAFILAAWSH